MLFKEPHWSKECRQCIRQLCHKIWEGFLGKVSAKEQLDKVLAPRLGSRSSGTLALGCNIPKC